MHAQTKSVEPANIHAFMNIPLAELVESKTNPRTVYDDLDELTVSIKAQGVIISARRTNPAQRLLAPSPARSPPPKKRPTRRRR